MKYKTFRALLIGGVGLLGVGGIAAAYAACDSGKSSAPTAVVETASKVPATATPKTASPGGRDPVPQTPATSELGAAQLDLSERDQAILARVRQGFTGDKVKDALKGASYKVNLYDEGGKVRLKVDLDRDEKWDEKWSLESKSPDDGVKRQISTKDDETYDLEYRLEAGRWRKKEGP